MSELDKKSKLLQEPFEPGDLEWRVQQQGVSNNGKPWVMVFAYVTNRAIQQRLDDVLGYDGWQNEYRPSPDGCGVVCGISIKCGDDWITKWDGAEKKQPDANDYVDETKSVLSNSMKRAAVQWGIGRYLYDLETVFAQCQAIDSRKDATHNYSYHKKSKTHIEWVTPSLPDWALPSVDADEFVEKMQESETVTDLKGAFAEAYLYAKAFGRTDLRDRFKEVYDEETERLDKEAQMNVDNALAEAQAWLTRQLNTLPMIPDESSVSRVCQTFREHIAKISDGQYYDTEPLYNQINEAEKNRLESIKNISSDEEPEK